MRITFIVPVLESSGGARIVAGHAKMLAARGHDVTLAVPIPEKLSLRTRLKIALGREARPTDPAIAHTSRAGVPIIHIPRNKLSDPSSYPDADVIIATFWITAEWIMPLPPSKGVKVHFLQHYEAFSNIPADRVDAVWRLPTSKIAIAKWLADLGRERFGLTDIALVPNSVDHDKFGPRDWGHDFRKQKTAGFVYSGTAFKDSKTSIAAMEKLKTLLPNVKVVAFGSSLPENDFPSDFDFNYLPSQETIAGIYQSSHVWLSTSLTEGFNLPPLEAMATGCPAVCSMTGRPLEIIQDGTNGFLVEQGDVDGFAQAMFKVLSLSEEAWETMSQRAIETVAHPTWDESNQLFEAALMSAVESRESRSQ